MLGGCPREADPVPELLNPGVAVTEPNKKPAPPQVYCRRVERKLPVTEHLECAYCFGKPGEVATSEHERFCDFEPGKDPIHFGFPPDYGG